MSEKSGPSIYMAPPESPLVKKYAPLFNQVSKEKKGVWITVTDEEVQPLYVEPLVEMLVALQHYPEAIEHFLFKISLKFYKPGRKAFYEGLQWQDDAHVLWLRALMKFPAVVFFLADTTCRGFALLGDMVVSRKLSYKKSSGQSAVTLVLDKQQMQTLIDRVNEACRFFQLYCLSTSVDVEKYITAILKETRVPITYEQIKEQLNTDIEANKRMVS